MKFPAAPFSFPTKDDMANYLEAYARRFQLPIRNGIRVDRLTRVGSRYLIEAGPERFEADHVVVVMSSYQVPRVPAFAKELRPDILQMHSTEYRNLRQLKPGVSFSLVPATRAPRSLSRWRASIRPGCRAATPGTYHSESTGWRRASS
jgi:hypothetical protein